MENNDKEKEERGKAGKRRKDIEGFMNYERTPSLT